MPTLKDIQEQGEKELENINIFDLVNGRPEEGHLYEGILQKILNIFHQQTTLAFQAGLDMVLKEIEDFSNRDDGEIIKDIGESADFPAPCSRKTCILLKEKIISNSK